MVATENESDPTSSEVVEAAFPLGADDFPPIDFSTFIVSLRASALMHLSDKAEPDALAFARQEIDLLGILAEKTRGNLSSDEHLLLSEILFDLRTRYLAARGR